MAPPQQARGEKHDGDRTAVSPPAPMPSDNFGGRWRRLWRRCLADDTAPPYQLAPDAGEPPLDTGVAAAATWSSAGRRMAAIMCGAPRADAAPEHPDEHAQGRGCDRRLQLGDRATWAPHVEQAGTGRGAADGVIAALEPRLASAQFSAPETGATISAAWRTDLAAPTIGINVSARTTDSRRRTSAVGPPLNDSICARKWTGVLSADAYNSAAPRLRQCFWALEAVPAAGSAAAFGQVLAAQRGRSWSNRTRLLGRCRLPLRQRWIAIVRRVSATRQSCRAGHQRHHHHRNGQT